MIPFDFFVHFVVFKYKSYIYYMSYSEREVVLSDIEIQELQTNKKQSQKYVLGFGGFILILLAFGASGASFSLLTCIIIGFFACIGLLLAFFVYRMLVHLYVKDLKGGTKIIVEGTIINKEHGIRPKGSGMKRASEAYYILVFDKRRVRVWREQYEQVAIGDTVHVEFTPFSNSVFDFRIR